MHSFCTKNLKSPHFLGTEPFFHVFLITLFCESLIHFCVLMILVEIFWICFLLYSFSIFLLLCIYFFLIFSFAATVVTGREILEGHIHTVLYCKGKDRGNTNRHKERDTVSMKSSDWRRKCK